MKNKFKVNGMHCVSCAMIIENEIEEMGEIEDVECSYKKNLLKIYSEGEITANQLNKMFEKFGYKFKEK